MDLIELNDNFFNPLMEKLASEDKNLFWFGDFNIDLLEVDPHNELLWYNHIKSFSSPYNTSYQNNNYYKNLNWQYLFELH